MLKTSNIYYIYDVAKRSFLIGFQKYNIVLNVIVIVRSKVGGAAGLVYLYYFEMIFNAIIKTALR